MTVVQALTAGRAAAEALMADTCTVTRPGTGERVFNADIGDYNDIPYDTVYSGKCRVQSSNVLDPRNVDYGGREVSTQEITVWLPIMAEGASDVEVGDTVTITEATFNPVLQGRELNVTGFVLKTHPTSQKLRCEVRTD